MHPWQVTASHTLDFRFGRRCVLRSDHYGKKSVWGTVGTRSLSSQSYCNLATVLVPLVLVSALFDLDTRWYCPNQIHCCVRMGLIEHLRGLPCHCCHSWTEMTFKKQFYCVLILCTRPWHSRGIRWTCSPYTVWALGVGFYGLTWQQVPLPTERAIFL